MTLLVVDASAAAAFVIEAQATQASRRLLAEWDRYDAVAPYVYALETPWLLLKRQRLSREPGKAAEGLALLARLNVEVQPALTQEELDVAFRLAVDRNMGFYDAMYLLLAVQTGGVLASRDDRLLTVASAGAVAAMDLR